MRIDATSKRGQVGMVFLIVFVTILVLAGNYVTAQVEGDPVAIPDLVTAFETLEQTSLALEEAEARSNVKAMARAREQHPGDAGDSGPLRRCTSHGAVGGRQRMGRRRSGDPC